MQDNASIHQVEVVQDLFNDLQIPKLNWPARSPDLNPIENVWGMMIRELNKLYDEQGEPRTGDQLWEMVQKVWNEITVQKINSLYESMPDRIQAVINAREGRTKY